MLAAPDPPAELSKSPSRQFGLRTLFVEVALAAVVFALLGRAFSAPYNQLGPVELLAAVALVAAMTGDALLRFRQPTKTHRRLRVVLFSLAFALGYCPIFVAMEWSNDHPWPPPDALYIILAILRCGLPACLIGCIVVWLLDLTERRIGPARHRAPVGLAVVFAALILLAWWPVRPWYQNRLANGRLLNAIAVGTNDDVAVRVIAVQQVHGETDAVGTVLFLALHSPDAKARARALRALVLLGDAANWTLPALKPLLDDESESVRSAAASLLSQQSNVR